MLNDAFKVSDSLSLDQHLRRHALAHQTLQERLRNGNNGCSLFPNRPQQKLEVAWNNLGHD
jgi:hypothetical protein